MKRGEPAVVYRSTPQNNAISSIVLGLSKGTDDKAYIANGQQILGYNKKGKEFFKFQTNISETINRLCVYDTKLWTATDFVYNQFDNGAEKSFYICQDRVNDLLLSMLGDNAELVPILACQDNYIRVMKGADIFLKKSISGNVFTLAKYPEDKNRLGSQIAYGTASGTFGVLHYTNGKLKTTWHTTLNISTGEKDSSVSCVNAICSYDINKDDSAELIIGRDDGRLEVYSYHESNGILKEFEYCTSESIRSIQTGIFNTPGFDEIVLCSYSGRIMSFTTEPLDQPDLDDSYGRSRGTVQRETRIVKLRKEIAQLEEKISKEKEKLERKDDSVSYLPVVEEFPVNSKFLLGAEDGTYDISIEIPMPILSLCLHSSVPVDLLSNELNQAILSQTYFDASRNNGNVLATFRCHEVTNRLDLRIRTIEGQFGDLELFILSDMVPKCAQCVKFYIKPLSLHDRINIVDEKELNEPMNSLHFTGNFSLVQVHEWISICLPQVPVRVQEEEVKMYFRNTYFGNILICEYR